MTGLLVLVVLFLIGSSLIAKVVTKEGSTVKWQGRVMEKPRERFAAAWLLSALLLATVVPVIVAHPILRRMGRCGFIHPTGDGHWEYDISLSRAIEYAPPPEGESGVHEAEGL